MLNRLIKNKYSSGGLYLANTVLVLSAFTQGSIAQEEYFSRQDVLNICNQISWRIIANNKIVDAKEGSWITDEYYSESIRNVIGKAIADCITGNHEFAGKTSIEDTITFDVEPAGYSPENWNAVVLWNLIHVYNCGFKNNENYTIDEAFKKVEINVKNKYSAQIADFDKILEKAMGDIREYAVALDLGDGLNQFYKVYQELKQQTWGIWRDTRVAPLLVVNYIYEIGEKEKDNITILKLEPKTYNKVRDIPFEVKIKYGRQEYDINFAVGFNYKYNPAYAKELWQFYIYGLNTLQKDLKKQQNEAKNNPRVDAPLFKDLHDLQWSVFVQECIDELVGKIANTRNRCGIEDKINNRLVYHFDPKDFLH